MTGFTFHILKLNTIAALIICAACVVSRLTRKKYTCKWKYYVWLVTALVLLIPVDLSSFSRVQLQIAQPTRQAGIQQNPEVGAAAEQNPSAGSDSYLFSDDTADTTAENSSALSSQTVQSFSTISETSDMTMPAASSSDHRISTATKTTVSSEPNDAAAAGTSAAPLVLSLHLTQVSLYGFLQLFSCIWLTGFVLLAAFRIFKYRFSLWSLRRWSSPVQNPDIIRLYRGICKREHISSPPKLMQNRNLSTPVLAGLFQPALYLTEAPYDREELAFILRHELTHYKRHDLWFKLLLLAVSTIYWFNPALYLMRSEAEKDIENLCDGRVLQSSPAQSRLHYSQLLLKTAALQNHIPYLSASLNDSKLIFKERIHYLTELASLRRGTPLCLTFCAALLIGNSVLGSSVLSTQAQSAVSSDAASNTSDANGSSILDEIDARATANAAQNAKGSDGSLISGTAAFTSPSNASAGLTSDVSAGDLMRSGQTNAQDNLNGSSSDAIDFADHSDSDGSSSENSTAFDGTSDFGGSYDDQGFTPDNTNSGSQDTRPGNFNPGSQDSTPGDSNPDASAPDTDPGTSIPGTDSSLPVLTDTRITLYALQETGANYVWQASDGAWYDGDYRKYLPNGDGTFTRADNQSQWTSETPPSPADHASDTVSLISEDGLNVNTLYYDSDSGIWQNIAGGIYTSNGDGTFTGPDGSLWTVTS